MGCASASNARHAVGVAERIAAPHVDKSKSARVLASSRDRRRYPSPGRACSHVAARRARFFFAADAIFDTRYISRDSARAVRRTLLINICTHPLTHYHYHQYIHYLTNTKPPRNRRPLPPAPPVIVSARRHQDTPESGGN